MKSGVIYLLCIVFIIGFTYAGEPTKCIEGQTKKVDCNDCHCTNGEWGCTEKLCDSSHPVLQYECTAGQSKMQDCNRCFCSGGRWACTLLLCPKHPIKRQVIGTDQESAVSREKREVPVAADLKNTPCAPNDYFMIDCNTCYCNLEHTGYLCTENYCRDGDALLDPTKTSEIRLSNDTRVVITNGDVKLVRDNETEPEIDNNLSVRVGKSKDLGAEPVKKSTDEQKTTDATTIAAKISEAVEAKVVANTGDKSSNATV